MFLLLEVMIKYHTLIAAEVTTGREMLHRYSDWVL